MAFREFGDQVERVGDFAAVLVENVNSTGGHHLVRELGLAPADVERRDHVVEEVGRDAARIVPVFAEAEEAVGVEIPFRGAAQPHFPVDVIIAFALGPGVRIDLPVPFTFDRVAMIGPLAHYQLADHPVLDGLAGLPPLVAGGRLRADLHDAVRGLCRLIKPLGLLDGASHGLFAINVLAGLHRLDGDRRVPVVRRGDDHGVDVLAGDHFAVIERGQFGLAELLGIVQPFAVNVANSDHLRGARGFAELYRPPHHAGASPPEPDAADVDAVVRAQNPRVDVGVVDRRGAGGGYAGFDEVSACGLLSHTNLLRNPRSNEFIRYYVACAFIIPWCCDATCATPREKCLL